MNGREVNENIQATEALVELQNVVRCLSNVWIEESGNHRQKKPANFDVKKVIFCVARTKLIAKTYVTILNCKLVGLQFLFWDFDYSVTVLEVLWF